MHECNYSGYFPGPDGPRRAEEAGYAAAANPDGSLYFNSPTSQSVCSNSGSEYAWVARTAIDTSGTWPNEIITHRWSTFHYDSPPPPTLDPGTGKTCDSAGNPVDFLSGNKYQTEVDYQGTGVLPLAFIRTYNSHANGWTFSYSATYNDQQLTLDDGAKKATKFIAASRYRYMSNQCEGCPPSGYDPDSAAVLPLDDASYHARVSGTQVRFTSPEGLIDTFDTANGGRLVRRENATGQWLTFTYSGGRLVTVTHFSGRRLRLTYDSQGRLATLRDPGNRITTYTWDAQNRLTRVTYPDSTATNPNDNPYRVYHYEDASWPMKLTGITDEAGRRYATWAYDGTGRAVLSTHANAADRHTFEYFMTPGDGDPENDRVAVTNPLGRRTVYDVFLDGPRTRVTRVDGEATALCGAMTSSVDYDYNNFVSKRIDNVGNVTTYVHDARGLETSRTEGFGTADARTITTEWHPTLTLPTRIVRPGQLDERTYDANGRMLSRTLTDTQTQSVPYSTQGNTRTWTYTYHPTFGLVASIDGPRTDVPDITTYSYDAKGDVQSITNALGQVTTVLARDTRGLPTQIRDANNTVTAFAWDPRGRLSRTTVLHASGDAITVYQYDKAGLLTRVTLPNGQFLIYTYDTAQRLVAITNNLGERIRYTSRGHTPCNSSELDPRRFWQPHIGTHVRGQRHTAVHADAGVRRAVAAAAEPRRQRPGLRLQLRCQQQPDGDGRYTGSQHVARLRRTGSAGGEHRSGCQRHDVHLRRPRQPGDGDRSHRRDHDLCAGWLRQPDLRIKPGRRHDGAPLR